MNDDLKSANWEKIKEIFVLAIDHDGSSRSAFVVESCAGDEVLREEVESWLASYEEAEHFIEVPVSNVNEVFPADPPPAEKQFGNYRIIREIGAGGMGAVYLAERADGEFSQLVAIKIIRQAIAEIEIINRFKRERQILASLNHPNIARLLDGGVSEDGSPFLAMEFVEGETISRFVADNRLHLEARLKLFLKVCAAVAYAHRNLIVHRDLKPSNILVTTAGEPKLLDFGLAKLTDENLINNEVQTQTAFRALTPAYASPEQLKGEPITTASDIYSLGVVLYELLTTERPFRLDGKSLEEIIKTVTFIEPPPPSANPKSKAHNSKLKGDLDNIVLMALRREVPRRYSSVEAFADDIERFLKGLPVAARSNTFKYRAAKFIKRNKIGVLAASLILASLLGGIVISIWQARIAGREKEKAESINEFLEQTLKYSNPIFSNSRIDRRETTVNEVLDEAARRLDSGEFDGYPEVKTELERTVAVTYLGQSKFLQSRKHMERYVTLLRQLYGENHPKMIAGSMLWAQLLFAKDELDEAEKIYRRYLPPLRSECQKGTIKTEILADALNQFAYLRRTQGDSTEAEGLFRETLELIPKLPPGSLNDFETTRSTLASTMADQGRFEEALETSREAVAEFQSRGETDSPTYGFVLTVYGGFLAEKGDYKRADSALLEAETIFRKLMSPHALWLGDNLRNQSASLHSQGKFSEALDKVGESLKIYEESFGKHYDNYPTALIVKGLSLAKTGQTGDGEKILREAVALRAGSLPKEHFWVSLANSALGECLTLEKKYAEAEKLLTESHESLKRSQGPDNPRTLLAQSRLDTLNEIRVTNN